MYGERGEISRYGLAWNWMKNALEMQNPIQLSEAAPVIGPQYCCPLACELKIVSRMLSITDKHLDVLDSNGNVVFRLKGHTFTLHDRRHLTDPAGNVIATLKANLVSLHDRWVVYRGESNSHKDLIFTVKRSSVLHFKTNLDVFLATDKDKTKLAKEEEAAAAAAHHGHKHKENKEEAPPSSSNSKGKRSPDYRVAGCWHEKACMIFYRDTNYVAAQMIEKMTALTVVMGHDHFGVSVAPFVDYALIVSIIVILDAIHKEN